jgi:hypothetical protein
MHRTKHHCSAGSHVFVLGMASLDARRPRTSPGVALSAAVSQALSYEHHHRGVRTWSDSLIVHAARGAPATSRVMDARSEVGVAVFCAQAFGV